MAEGTRLTQLERIEKAISEWKRKQPELHAKAEVARENEAKAEKAREALLVEAVALEDADAKKRLDELTAELERAVRDRKDAEIVIKQVEETIVSLQRERILAKQSEARRLNREDDRRLQRLGKKADGLLAELAPIFQEIIGIMAAQQKRAAEARLTEATMLYDLRPLRALVAAVLPLRFETTVGERTLGKTVGDGGLVELFNWRGRIAERPLPEPAADYLVPWKDSEEVRVTHAPA
jgi:hypothetical protein